MVVVVVDGAVAGVGGPGTMATPYSPRLSSNSTHVRPGVNRIGAPLLSVNWVGWVRLVRDQCTEAGVPFFFKQWGGRTPKAQGRLLDGRIWEEIPAATGGLDVLAVG